MKIKLLKQICSPEGSFDIGETIDLPGKMARALVENCHAEKIIEVENNLEVKIENEKTDLIIEQKQIKKSKLKG